MSLQVLIVAEGFIVCLWTPGAKEVVQGLVDMLKEDKDEEMILRTTRKRIPEMPESTKKLVEGEE